tara:strand:- start:245 stop:553 length:309 start_codon:yes stop_codon:yes gene_type:complete
MKFLEEFKNKKFGNNMIAHHLDPNAPAGDIPFTEPSLEDLVEMVKKGKLGKEVLGDDADIMLQYGTPSQRRKQLEDTGSLEIPVIPFQSGKQFLDSYRTPPG